MNILHAFRKWVAGYDTGKGLLILLIVTLLPYFVLSFYNHPNTDDYTFTTCALRKGFFEAQKYWYLNWTGRYFAVAVISLNPLVFHSYWGYKLTALVLLMLLLIATYLLAGKLFKYKNKAGKIGVTALFIFTYIIMLPKPSSAIYVLNTSYQCLLSGVLMLFLLGSMISYYTSGARKYYFILSCVLVIAIIGSYELSMVFVDVVVALFLFVSIVKRQKWGFPLTLLAVCIIFSLIEITAPGNVRRGVVMYPYAHKAVYSIKAALIGSKNLLIAWLPFMLLTGFLSLDLLTKQVKYIENDASFFIFSPGLIFLLCLAIPVTGLFIVFWAMGFTPERVLNMVCFYFVLGMMYFLFSVFMRLKKRYPDFSLPVYSKLPVYFILMYILFFRTNNISVAYADIISGTASAYNRERIEENEFLTNCKLDSCRRDSIKDIPKSLFFSELPQGKEPMDSLTNEAFFQYYHKKYIGLK